MLIKKSVFNQITKTLKLTDVGDGFQVFALGVVALQTPPRFDFDDASQSRPRKTRRVAGRIAAGRRLARTQLHNTLKK